MEWKSDSPSELSKREGSERREEAAAAGIKMRVFQSAKKGKWGASFLSFACRRDMCGHFERPQVSKAADAKKFDRFFARYFDRLVRRNRTSAFNFFLVRRKNREGQS